MAVYRSSKDKHLKKVQEIKVITTSDRSIKVHLDIPVEECNLPSLPSSTLQGIWAKAEVLVNSPTDIIETPWVKSEYKAKLVKSSSSDYPHLVKASTSGFDYKCDDKCQMFKAFSLCSHVVAVAQVNGNLKNFLESHPNKFVPNLSAISQRNMPSGSRRKGGAPKRKKKNIETTSF